jgi:hypothetical protein
LTNCQAPHYTAWMDDFLTSYYKNRPVSATFIGMHDYDHALPDFSDAGTAQTVHEMEALLGQLDSLPVEPLQPIEEIDRKLAEGYLRTQLWEYSSQHFQYGNPSLYTGEAIFGLIGLFLSNYAPMAERIKAAKIRLESIPLFLEQGSKNISKAPAAWTERAVRECEGGIFFLKEGFDLLISCFDDEVGSLRKAVVKAQEAIKDYQYHLEQVVRKNPTDQYGCGEQPLDLIFRWGHFSEGGANGLEEYAIEQLNKANEYLNIHASDFGGASVEEALSKLTNLHPTADQYYQHYTDLWQECREVVIRNELVSMPDFPIEYVPRPEWARKAAPYLYFLFYRSPAAFNRPPIHQYLVLPLDKTLSAVQQEEFLCSNNDSVIKLNHVVHHGCIGHHVQNWNAYQSKSRIGQIAAVDCAARIAMLCGGTMAEGWACYATELMSEAGFLTPLEQYSEHHSRRRMCARAIVDVQLHQGKMTFEDAVRFFQEQGGMSPSAAHSEAVKTSMFPGSASMYILGTDGIKSLRNEIQSTLGWRFHLRDFHDQFLSFGSIPVALISTEMKRIMKND